MVPFEVRVIPDRPFTAKIDANGEVSPFLQLLASESTSISGQARVALDISGTFDNPKVNGNLDLRHCTYEGLDTGCILRNIEAQFEGRGSELVLTRLSAEDGLQGRVTGTGAIRLDSANKYPFDIAFNITNTLMLRRDYVQARATGILNLFGNGDAISLHGQLTADNLTVTIPKQMPTPAASLDITFVNSPNAARGAEATKEGKKERPLDFNIAIDIPGRAYVRSDELKSEWRGGVTLSGTSNALALHGELQVTKGDYLLNGKPFRLDKGTISFGGDLEKKTNLYVVASQEIDRYTIQAVLKGAIKNPELTLRSNPHLSQREILSWLIFGRGLNDITALESDQAGQAVVDISKSGQSSMPSMMSRLKRLGIDRIDFNRDDSDDNAMSVNVGKYLSRDLFISLNRGITRETNRVCVEANVIRHVKLEAEVDDDATGGIRLMWKHDY